MTLLVGWAALDRKGAGYDISSIHFATDSRFTYYYNEKPYQKQDFHRKVYGCLKSPNIFAFCGDANCPTFLIKSIVKESDACGLLSNSKECHEKFSIVKDFFSDRINCYNNSIVQDFTIYHATRTDRKEERRTMHYFHVYKYSVNKESMIITAEEIALPKNNSDVFCIDGSGKDIFMQRWQTEYGLGNNNYRTSRAVYQCLCETLASSAIETVGTIPQIMGLIRINNSIQYGTIIEDKLYTIYEDGIKLIEDESEISIDSIKWWRNENYEIANPYTRKRNIGAQSQPLHIREATP